MLLYDISFLECLSEYIRGILTQPFFAVWSVADGSRCSNRTKVTFLHVQFQFQTAYQIGHIGTLGTIVGMQLIQHDELQRLVFRIDITPP